MLVVPMMFMVDSDPPFAYTQISGPQPQFSAQLRGDLFTLLALPDGTDLALILLDVIIAKTLGGENQTPG